MTTEPRDGSRAPRRPIGVRTRIMTAVLLLTALGMALAGVAFSLFEKRQLVTHLETELIAGAEAFQSQVSASAGPGLSVDEILRRALQLPAPADQVIMGMVDGHPRYVTDGVRPFPIENETALVKEIAALPPGEPTRLRRSTASIGEVRYVAVQIQVAGRPERGTYVAAAGLEPGGAQLAASTRQYALLSVAALAIVAAGSSLVAGRLLRPLRGLRIAAQRISHTDLTARIPVTGRDDVTELTRTVNDMLERLQSAFDGQQQFLDDAGHELRTPLTVVLGHLELCDITDAAEVRDTHALVVDELDRMARLVSDLIVLAQAGRPDFVRFGPVDLDRFMHAVLEKAQGLADRQWLLDGKTGLVALADEQRLTQAVLQLADNAVRHTRPGDVIALGGAATRAGVLLWVRDSGPGVAPEDVERIFERFGRAGSQHRHEGSGLGLSIVAGIAAAHGGQVTLDPHHLSDVGGPGGACFTLRLPLTVLAQARSAPLRSGRTMPARRLERSGRS